MDLNSIIAIVIAVVVIYLFIKFIVSPIFKAIFGIITFIILIYILQRFFNFDLSQILGPFAKYVNLKSFSWIFSPINGYIDQAKNFLYDIFENIKKSINK